MHSGEVIVGYSELSSEQTLLVRGTLRSILDSTYFRKSKRYPALLEYAVLHTLDGDLGALNERAVAMAVFGRSTDYEPSTDSVVRTSLGEVRRRIALYFGDHPEAPVRIELPHGSYTAEFLFRAQPEPAGEVSDELPSRSSAQPPAAVPPRKQRRRWTIPLAAATAAAMVLALAIWYAARLNRDQPLFRFWAPLLHSHASVLITLGTPSKFITPHWAAGLPNNALINYLHSQPNNPVPDMDAANLVQQFLSSRGTKSEIQMDNSTAFSDLRRGPAVILGGGPMSSWAMRLGAQLPFQYRETEDGAVHFIVDTTNPSSHGWKVDLRLPYDQINNDYALITRQWNPATGQWWIGIGGTTGLSLSEAEKLFIDRSWMKSLAAQLPAGWENKNLQIVLEFTLLNGSAARPQVVASRAW